VTNEDLYLAIDTILTELADVFPDKLWHVGGDEPHFACWTANKKVAAYMKAHGLTAEGLYAQFSGRYAKLVHSHNKSVIGWEEVQTTKGTAPSADTIVEVWEGNNALDAVVKAGFRATVSSNWYLDDGGDWVKYWSDDPLSYLDKPTAEQKALVLGGESCMWNSKFDAHSNMEPAMWPNAAAAAEMLWSPLADVKNTTVEQDARTRLSQHRCRMVRRGVRASPLAEDYCSAELYVRRSRSYSHPGDFPPSPYTPPP